MRDPEVIRAEIREKQERLWILKHGSGFRLGHGKWAKAEAFRRRREIDALFLELVAAQNQSIQEVVTSI